MCFCLDFLKSCVWIHNLLTVAVVWNWKLEIKSWSFKCNLRDTFKSLIQLICSWHVVGKLHEIYDLILQSLFGASKISDLWKRYEKYKQILFFFCDIFREIKPFLLIWLEFDILSKEKKWWTFSVKIILQFENFYKKIYLGNLSILLLRSKCSIFQNICKTLTLQRCPKALLCRGKGMCTSSPNPIIDNSSWWDNSNKWSNIGFGEEMTQPDK